MVWKTEIEEAMHDFLQVASLAGEPIEDHRLARELLEAPHSPPSRLPSGRMAVYGFWGQDQWLKIGKAGPQSGPRYTSHHYNLSAQSSLAKSLAKDESMRDVDGFRSDAPGDWIRAHTNRVNILAPAGRSKALLSLLETFLHARLKPRYEGSR